MIPELIDNLSLLFVLIPFIFTLILYQISYLVSKKRWKAIHISVQVSSLFYIIAVSILLEKHLQESMIGYILIGLLTLLSVILIVQWKMNTEVVLKKGLKVLLRISFLVFFVTYFLLISYEIIQIIYINYSN